MAMKVGLDCGVANVVYSLVDKERWMHHEYGSPVTVSKNELVSRACQLCAVLKHEFIFAPVGVNRIMSVYNNNSNK